MTRNSILLLVLIIAIMGGAIWYFSTATPAPTTTVPPVVVTPPVTPVPPVVAKKPAAPIVITDSVGVPSDTTVVLNGKIIANGSFTTYWFEYGTQSTLGSKSPNQSLGSSYATLPAPAYITGLTPNTTYYFRLNASNQFGTVNGTQYTFKTPQGTPAPVGSAPTTKTLAASGISRTTANINGEITPNQAETTYWFEYGTTNDLTSETALQSAGAGTAKVSISMSLSNLEPLTTYYFRLNAQNRFGTVTSQILNFKTAGPANPDQPTAETKSATNVTATSSVVRGNVNPNGSETQYWFEYSTESLLGSVLANATERKSVGAGFNTNSVTATLTGLSPKTTYNFRLVAENTVGTVRGSQMSFTTK